MAYTRSASSVPYHTFHVPRSETSELAIKIAEPDLRADSLTLTTWTSAFVLTRRLWGLELPGLERRDGSSGTEAGIAGDACDGTTKNRTGSGSDALAGKNRNEQQQEQSASSDAKTDFGTVKESVQLKYNEAVDGRNKEGIISSTNSGGRNINAEGNHRSTTDTTTTANSQSQSQSQCQLQPHSTVSSSNQAETVIPLLELGAGTALAGLSAAGIFSTHAVLTDLPALVPGLRHNIALNAELLRECGAKVECGALDWRNPSILLLNTHDENDEGGDDKDQEEKEKKTQVENSDQNQKSAPTSTGQAKFYSSQHTKALTIVAADTVYDADHPALLARAIAAWLSPHRDARVVLTIALRVAYLEYISELWQLMEGLGLEVEGSGQERAEEGLWEDDDERLCEWSVWRWRETDRRSE